MFVKKKKQNFVLCEIRQPFHPNTKLFLKKETQWWQSDHFWCSSKVDFSISHTEDPVAKWTGSELRVCVCSQPMSAFSQITH